MGEFTAFVRLVKRVDEQTVTASGLTDEHVQQRSSLVAGRSGGQNECDFVALGFQLGFQSRLCGTGRVEFLRKTGEPCRNRTLYPQIKSSVRRVRAIGFI